MKDALYGDFLSFLIQRKMKTVSILQSHHTCDDIVVSWQAVPLSCMSHLYLSVIFIMTRVSCLTWMQRRLCGCMCALCALMPVKILTNEWIHGCVNSPESRHENFQLKTPEWAATTYLLPHCSSWVMTRQTNSGTHQSSCLMFRLCVILQILTQQYHCNLSIMGMGIPCKVTLFADLVVVALYKCMISDGNIIASKTIDPLYFYARCSLYNPVSRPTDPAAHHVNVTFGLPCPWKQHLLTYCPFYCQSNWSRKQW